jgi:hypothetical protein
MLIDYHKSRLYDMILKIMIFSMRHICDIEQQPFSPVICCDLRALQN